MACCSCWRPSGRLLARSVAGAYLFGDLLAGLVGQLVGIAGAA